MHLLPILADFVLQTGKGEAKAPQVVAGYLPPKNANDEPEFPYVGLRLLEGEDTTEDGKATVKIYIGTHDEDANGWRDAANVLFRIREHLLTKPVLAERYRLELPLRWKIYEEQVFPQWFAELTTSWIVPRPVEIFEEVDYGSEE